ncbi:hypothetical protein GOZ78_17780 [Agrobacterium vitis]|uniref:Uncharacterized protein n=2 Tax=Agrobacterium vitis TaxID=373 RepID=A0ABD6GJZ7_AGRVI|nr:hypothetical protein [Agrobacterium vitis]MUO79708.1 hypothetical protein [Agrobacterium vitis]MUO96860.1 hypothetical protein [Agrobacterium vitis]MUP07679.1 hypothetical protein [Agrobacterium vitis]MUZ83637.1 hypothetical protein [Agrobacterium vitis]MVA11872.1 hypothetical protein [Agrobacterium vitis]
MSFFEKIFARRAINPMLIDKKDYHAFTTDFDHIVKSEDLDQVLGPLAQDDAAILDHA